MINPPRIAPGKLPSPPKIAAPNPFIASIAPLSYSIREIGVIVMPATAPIPAERAKESSIICLTLIPTRLAASGLSAQALIALPIMVRLKKMDSAITMMIKKPITHKYCGWMTAPKKVMGSRPEKAGRSKESLPQINIAAPLIRIEAAIVAIIRVSTDGRRMGLIANRSRSIPTRVTRIMVAGKAKIRGSPMATCKKTIINPPNMTNSPWAKFMISVTL